MKQLDKEGVAVDELFSSVGFRAAPVARRARVLATHLKIFFEFSRPAAAASVLAVMLIWLTLQGHAQLVPLSLWAVTVLVLVAVHQRLARRFLGGEPSLRRIGRWRRVVAISSVAQGLSWAGLLYVAAQYGLGAGAGLVAVVIMCALSFGSFAVLGLYLPAFIGFSLPILTLTLAWFVVQVPDLSPWLGGVLLAGYAVTAKAGLRATRALRGALLGSIERGQRAGEVAAEMEQIQVTLRAIGDGVISTDTAGRVRSVNAVAERLTGWRDRAARGRLLAEVLQLSDADAQPVPDVVARCLNSGDPLSLEGEYRLRGRDGEEYAVQLKASPIRDNRQQLVGVVVVLQDVTELAGLAQAMSYQAEHDSLTGLLNRTAFEQRLESALERARLDGWTHALCYLDLDQFKVVNDTCGHAAGDELLRRLAARLEHLVRDSDVLARMGGDEFAVLFYRCSLDKARELAEALSRCIQAFRFECDGQTFTVGASIGLLPVDGSGSLAQLMAAADAACYVAKDRGRNRVHIVYPDDTEVASRHGEMRATTQIQRALDEDRFRLRLQRICPLGDAGETKAEFLLSMLDDAGAPVPPLEFLPAAERFNMMPRIDRHVVRLALAYVAEARPELADIDVFAINLSGQSLAEPEFLDYVVEELQHSGVAPARLCFEITETAVIGDIDRALVFIRGLRERGCRFSLDDFGSGLSSFGYLRQLPVDYLKIDGQFVRDMCDDPINHAMVEAINQVGQTMGLRTVAEFVEDARTLEALRLLGVDFAQGWGLHRPALLEQMPAVRQRSA